MNSWLNEKKNYNNFSPLLCLNNNNRNGLGNKNLKKIKCYYWGKIKIQVVRVEMLAIGLYEKKSKLICCIFFLQIPNVQYVCTFCISIHHYTRSFLFLSDKIIMNMCCFCWNLFPELRIFILWIHNWNLCLELWRSNFILSPVELESKALYSLSFIYFHSFCFARKQWYQMYIQMCFFVLFCFNLTTTQSCRHQVLLERNWFFYSKDFF